MKQYRIVVVDRNLQTQSEVTASSRAEIARLLDTSAPGTVFRVEADGVKTCFMRRRPGNPGTVVIIEEDALKVDKAKAMDLLFGA